MKNFIQGMDQYNESYLSTMVYSELSQIFTMELFSKIVNRLNVVNYFHRNLQLRCLTGFRFKFFKKYKCSIKEGSEALTHNSPIRQQAAQNGRGHENVHQEMIAVRNFCKSFTGVWLSLKKLIVFISFLRRVTSQHVSLQQPPRSLLPFIKGSQTSLFPCINSHTYTLQISNVFSSPPSSFFQTRIKLTQRKIKPPHFKQ